MGYDDSSSFTVSAEAQHVVETTSRAQRTIACAMRGKLARRREGAARRARADAATAVAASNGGLRESMNAEPSARPAAATTIGAAAGDADVRASELRLERAAVAAATVRNLRCLARLVNDPTIARKARSLGGHLARLVVSTDAPAQGPEAVPNDDTGSAAVFCGPSSA